MEIQVLKENLAKTIQLATKFVSNKAQLPILSYLAIEAGDRGIFVTATSLDVSIRIRMAGKIAKTGGVAVPAKILGELAQSLPLGGVTLSLQEDGALCVSAQRMKAKIQAMRMEEFPPFPEEPAAAGELELGKLERVYDRVGFAVSADEARPILTGFLWQWKSGSAVATDGYRLSLVVDKGVLGVEREGPELVVVPGRPMVQLLQAFSEMKCARIRFGYAEQGQQLALMGDDVVGIIRVLAGEFPKYEGILPGALSIEFQASREALLSAVRSVAIFARDSANIVRFRIDEGRLEIAANAVQVGENVAEVEIEPVKAGKGTIAFNSKYLLDFLAHAASDRVGFGMNDPLKAGLFYEVGVDGYRHVIMPVRVRE